MNASTSNKPRFNGTKRHAHYSHIAIWLIKAIQGPRLQFSDGTKATLDTVILKQGSRPRPIKVPTFHKPDEDSTNLK